MSTAPVTVDLSVDATAVERKLADVDPYPMDLRAIGFAGARRKAALAVADEELDRIARAVLEAGDRANVALAAKLAGVARDTIYARVARLREAAS